VRCGLAVAAAAALAVPLAAQQQASIVLTPGLVIDRSVRVRPGTYRLPSGALDMPAVTIRGANVTVDLTGVTVEGGPRFADPDGYTGTGVFVDGAAGVTLRGGALRGYKVGILARRAALLHVTGTDVSFNWKPRLLSGVEQEHQSDWLSFHHNERDEWLRYGAGIYLSESDDAEIDHVRAVQGMNGLLVTRSSRLTIWNNTFSWLSGVGIGFYRTTDSQVMHNRIDWCVRGYSHGFYNRGQDSAGLLMYEQSSRNHVAFNSITHGGDGVFLWAGQSTMDTGQGGANDNVFYDNDVSHAVANGIEATFSRNTIIRNRIDDSWHGIWGGYSFDSLIDGNTFRGNTEGIAIEHGQNITIRGNTFSGGETAIRLWANVTQDPNWGYPKFRDTSSRDYVIADNRFGSMPTAMSVTRTAAVQESRNVFTNVMTPRAFTDVSTAVDRTASGGMLLPFTPLIAGGMDAKLPPGARRGRGTIIVDEWGPYDYQSPKLWPAGSPHDRPLTLRVLGAAGRWVVAAIRSVTVATRSGSVPGEIVVTPDERSIDFEVELEYRGERVVTPRGQVIPAGQPFRFGYSLFDPSIDWTIDFWKFDRESDPLSAPKAFAARLATAPVRTMKASRLAFANARAFGDGFADHVAIVASGTLVLEAGQYELAVTSDDGIRVWLDDRLVLEDWSIHAPKEDRIPVSGGVHRLRLEYFQNTGAAALQVQIRKGV
jgi:parallel beta-helix repeat protein